MGEDLILDVGDVITPVDRLEDMRICIKKGVIDEISKSENRRVEPDVDFSSCLAVPGFVDIHTHGYKGYATSSGRVKDLTQMAKHLPEHGVTSFLPSTVSETEEKLTEVAEAFKAADKTNYSGAEMVGLHLEGPHFGEGEEKGAQNVEVLRPPDVGELESLVEASGDNIKRVTIAPELDEAPEYIEKAVSMGILVSAGHTDASYEEAIDSFDKGVKIVSHLFNGMKKFHHREPGIIGACLTRDDVYAEIIADLIHLHPGAIELAIRAKGVEKLVLVTDSVSATGLPDGEYELGGQEIIVEEGVSRVKETGRLAGSTLTLEKAVKNIVEKTDLELEKAVKMATLNPASVLELDDRGMVSEGYLGDLAILDKNLEIVATIVRGEIFWSS